MVKKDDIKKVQTETEKAIADFLKEASEITVKSLQDEIVSSDIVATKKLFNKVKYTIKGSTSTIRFAKYAGWVHFGSSPSSEYFTVSPRSILKWMQARRIGWRKNIKIKERLAFLISRSIATEGVSRHKGFVDVALKKSDEKITALIIRSGLKWSNS